MSGRRALVTGGAGFIGSHLADRLIAGGYHVRALDDLSTGSLSNVAHLEGSSAFELTTGSVLDGELVGSLVRDCDLVFHLAAAVGVEYVIHNQIKAMNVNVRGTEVVLEHASRMRKKAILFSTSEIYGKSEAVPFKEGDDSALGPTTVARWGYAVTKALDEIMALAYSRERGLKVVIVRCFNTCGPRQTGRYGMVVPRFAKQALAGEPITVFGDGSQTRCFAYVGDVVDGVARLAECEQATGEIFNIGSDREVTIMELAREVKRVSGSASPIRNIPYSEAYGEGFEDMTRRVPDLSKIRALIGYEARTDLEGIIRSVLESPKS